MDEKELNEITILNGEKIKEALRKGEIETAIQLVDHGMEVRKSIHDFLVTWVDELMTVIAERLGDEAVYENLSQRYGIAGAQIPTVFDAKYTPYSTLGDAKFKLPIEDLVRVRVMTMCEGHEFRHMRLEEDDEKFTLILDPCGSGGELLIRSPFGNRDKNKKAYSWTHGKEKNLSFYCAHCVVQWEIAGIDKIGWPRVVYDPPLKPGDPCIQYMYKDPKKIPEKYWTRVGKERKVESFVVPG